MTVTSNRAARNRGGPPPRPPDGVLLRVLVSAADAWAGFPTAPEDSDVSVSFSTPAAANDAEALEALGYRAVGVVAGDGSAEPAADFLVSQAVIERHPHWWRSLAERSDRAFSLAMGPVQTAFAEVLRTHREPLH
ncbi:MAG: hypothetical protein ACR2KP_01355 [Egibacteraceae bacterium]